MTGRPERALFAALLLLHLVPLLVGPVFPSQDGASHVESAANLRHYADPDRALLRTYYVLNPVLEPNLFGHLLLIAGMEVADPLTAEKLMVALFVLAFPLAVRYALRAVAPDAVWLSVLAFPFVYSWPLHMGFFNFCWGLPLFFATIGFWLRSRAAPTPARVGGLSLLTLLLWSAHVVPLLLALGVIGLWVVFERGRAWRPTLLALLPVFFLLGLFLWRKQPVPSDRPPMGALWRGLLGLESLVSFDRAEQGVAVAVVALFAVLLAAGLVSRRPALRWRVPDALLVAAFLFTILYFVAPRRIAGGAYLNERLALFPFFALILWLGAQPFPSAWRRAVSIAGSTLAVSSLALHVSTYRELRAPMTEFLAAAPHLEPHHTLLPLSFAAEGWGRSRLGGRTKVFLHTASYLAVQRGLVNLANYEGNYVHFPLLFRDEVNPFVHLAADQGLEGEPPCADIEEFTRRTGQAIDYVLLWGLRARHVEGEPCTQRLLAHLGREYTQTFVSEPRRLVRLYARRDRR